MSSSEKGEAKAACGTQETGLELKAANQRGGCRSLRLGDRDGAGKHLLDWLEGHSQKSDRDCGISCRVVKKAWTLPALLCDLDQVLSYAGPQFPHLQSGENKTHLLVGSF